MPAGSVHQGLAGDQQTDAHIAVKTGRGVGRRVGFTAFSSVPFLCTPTFSTFKPAHLLLRLQLPLDLAVAFDLKTLYLFIFYLSIMRAVAALLALATSALAFQVTQPTNATGWVTSGQNTVSWQAVSTDPANFTIVLVNEVCHHARFGDLEN